MRFTRNKPTVPLNVLESRKTKQHSKLLKVSSVVSGLLVLWMTSIGGCSEKAHEYMQQFACAHAWRTESTLAWSVWLPFSRHWVQLFHNNALYLTESDNDD